MYNTDRHRITHCAIGNIDISDHSPLYLTVDLYRNPRRTFWKLNSSILNSPVVKKGLGEEIQMYFELNDTGEVDPPMLWDAFKAVIRGNIIARSAYLKRTRQERLDTLQSKLKLLQRKHKDNVDPNMEQEMNIVKNEIDGIYTQEIQKKLVYLKQKYWEVGGKASKLLAYRLRKKQADSTIYKIKNPETKKIECQQEKN